MKNKKRKVRLRFKLLLLAFFLVYAGVAIYGQQVKIDTLQDKQQTLATDYEQAQLELNRLEHKKEYMNTNDYIEDTAREKFGLVYKNEIIFAAEEDLE